MEKTVDIKNSDIKDNSVFFYHSDHPFSNFYSCSFKNDKITFNCSEQYFMYYKCLTFDGENSDLKEKILSSNDPSKIKKFGRCVKNYDDTVWNEKRFDIMCEALRLKFSQNDYLLDFLLKTKNKQIYEASPSDKIWGIGYSVKQAPKIDPELYGKNLLGIALMKVRDEFLNEKINNN